MFATWETLLLICCLAGARIAFAASAPTGATAITPIDSIREAARTAATRLIPSTDGKVIAEPAALDPRLRLARCEQTLQAVAPAPRQAQTRIYVSVSCAAGATWRINVPVDLSVERAVLVLLTPISRGQPIAAVAVRAEHRRVPGLTQRYIGGVAGLKDVVARRTLSVGEVLTADALIAAKVVTRGQQITLLTEVGGIAVRAPGIALADASLNQRVRVKNAASQRTVEGRVESADIVRVAP
ncbi:MAG: flagellar basal body P-ring formation protein FlgA [Proteobacteria bacterium]|nr:flagellar basal body P-ring formation protein FlgA [Pseudomonadota bacterium]